MSKDRPGAPIVDADGLRTGLEAAARQALSEGDLSRCVGESGTVVLSVQLRLDRGRVFYVDGGITFQRRMH